MLRLCEDEAAPSLALLPEKLGQNPRPRLQYKADACASLSREERDGEWGRGGTEVVANGAGI